MTYKAHTSPQGVAQGKPPCNGGHLDRVRSCKKPVFKDWLFLFGRAPKAPVYAETSLPLGGREGGRKEGKEGERAARWKAHRSATQRADRSRHYPKRTLRACVPQELRGAVRVSAPDPEGGASASARAPCLGSRYAATASPLGDGRGGTTDEHRRRNLGIGLLDK